MMPKVWGLLAPVVLTATIATTQPPPDETLHFAVLRDGNPIGTTTIRVQHGGPNLLAETVTHIKVKLGFLTLYTFDQSEIEHWADGHFQTLSAQTDDNGARHTVSAQAEGGAIEVDADGKSRRIDRAIIPGSLWNPALVSQKDVLDLQDGSIVPQHVLDRGIEQIALGGRPTAAHHYLIEGTFAQNVWYDQDHRLVKMEMRGSDGSRIEYRLE